MKIFLATASVDEVQWGRANGLIDGIATTPALLADAHPGQDERELLAELCRAAGSTVIASVGALNGRDIYRDGKELAKISEHIVVQVPLVEDAIVAMRRLTVDGIRVNTGLVFDTAQAILAAKAGAASVSIEVDRLDAIGQDAAAIVRQIRTIFEIDAVPCDLVAARPSSAARFADCAVAGADSVVVTPEMLRAMLLHPLTDRGLDQLLSDLSRHHGRLRFES